MRHIKILNWMFVASCNLQSCSASFQRGLLVHKFKGPKCNKQSLLGAKKKNRDWNQTKQGWSGFRLTSSDHNKFVIIQKPDHPYWYKHLGQSEAHSGQHSV